MSARLRAWAALVGEGVLLLLAACTCVFAFVLVPWRAASMCARALAYAGDVRGVRHAPIAVGWLLTAQAVATITAIAIALAIGTRAGSTALVGVLVLLASIAVSTAWSPIALAPFALVDGEGGVVPALVRSFELAARLGSRRTIALGARIGVTIGAFAAVAALGEDGAPIAVALGVTFGVPLAVAWLASTYADAKATAAFDPRRDSRVIAGLRTLVGLVVPAAALFVLALIVVALRPTRMRPLSTDEPRRARAVAAERRDRDRIELPGPHGLVVVATERGVSIETEDGGGAGVVEAPPDPTPAPELGTLSVVEGVCRGRAAFIAIRGGRWQTCFDDEGVRLDDSMSERLAARLTRHALALLAIAVGLSAWLALVLWRSLRDAQALDAPAWSRELGAVPVARIEGTLRFHDHARIELGRRSAHLEGDAHVVVDRGQTVVTLPSEIPLLAMDDVPLGDGSPVTIVAPTEGLRALGPRQGSIPFPPGARLVPGDRDHAAEHVLGRAARAASLLAIGIAAALGLAAAAIVLAP